MNILTLVYGEGNARVKRARRGMERDWNQYDEPLRKLLKTGDSMKKSRRWLEHRKKKFQKDVDRIPRVW